MLSVAASPISPVSVIPFYGYVWASRLHSFKMMKSIQNVGFYPSYQKSMFCQIKASDSTMKFDENDKKQSNHGISVLENISLATRNFPWEKVCKRFIERVFDLLWFPIIWFSFPIIAVSAVSECVYTLSAKKDFLIPVGTVIGVLMAKIFGDAFLDVEFQDGGIPWPLFMMIFVFILLKFPGPYYPNWAAAFLPHVANAGLLQIILYRQQKPKLT